MQEDPGSGSKKKWAGSQFRILCYLRPRPSSTVRAPAHAGEPCGLKLLIILQDIRHTRSAEAAKEPNLNRGFPPGTHPPEEKRGIGALIDDGIHIGLAPNVHARVNSRNRCLVNCHPLAPTAAECYPWKGNGALAPGCYPRRELAPVGLSLIHI